MESNLEQRQHVNSPFGKNNERKTLLDVWLLLSDFFHKSPCSNNKNIEEECILQPSIDTGTFITAL